MYEHQSLACCRPLLSENLAYSAWENAFQKEIWRFFQWHDKATSLCTHSIDANCVLFFSGKNSIVCLNYCYFIRHTLLREDVKVVLAEILSPANPLWLVYAMLPKLGLPTQLFVYHRLVLEAKVIKHSTSVSCPSHTNVDIKEVCGWH